MFYSKNTLMITPIILSKTDASEAKATFENWLEEPVILWVALGEDTITKEFVEKGMELLNSARSAYIPVKLIHALDPSLILEKLKTFI